MGRFEAIASHLKNNVAKTPAETLLLNIGNGFFLFGQKGESIMGYTQAMEMVNLISLEQGIRWHLQCNHYPPVPNQMIPVAVKAVLLCREGNFSETVKTPFEHRIHSWTVPAYVIVEAYHLEPWVNELEVD